MAIVHVDSLKMAVVQLPGFNNSFKEDVLLKKVAVKLTESRLVADIFEIVHYQGRLRAGKISRGSLRDCIEFGITLFVPDQ
jgi:hypothetical protein